MLEKDKVVSRIRRQIATCKELDSDWISLTVETGKTILDLIEDKPEVLRCRDCKYNIYDYGNMISCRRPNRMIEHHPPGWYCGDGERRPKG